MNENFFNQNNRKYLTVSRFEANVNAYLSPDPREEDNYFYVLPEEEFEKLDKLGVFEAINYAVDKNIEPFESDIIAAEDCGECLSILREKGVSSKSFFYQALVKTLDRGTYMDISF